MTGPQWNDLLVQYGIGAFETMRYAQGKIPLLTWHRQRSRHALRRWGLPENALDDTWNGLESQVQKVDSHAPLLRIKLLFGLGAQQQLIHHLTTCPFEVNETPRRLLIQPQVSYREQLYKSCQYEDHYFNFKLAKELGHDDVIYQNERGEALECSTAALLFSQGDRLCAIRGPTLASSSIQSLLDRYPQDMIIHAPINVEHLPSKTMWFACNALHGIVPISRMEDSSDQHRELPIAPTEMTERWNKRLFAHS
jgi:branched-subunit amino acid aminotransferase/4-amino-4-deoxychorismate lyase